MSGVPTMMSPGVRYTLYLENGGFVSVGLIAIVKVID
jgi:hypothetical protein